MSTTVLAQHAAALLDRDAGPPSAATLAPSATAFRTSQLAVYANTAAVSRSPPGSTTSTPPTSSDGDRAARGPAARRGDAALRPARTSTPNRRHCASTSRSSRPTHRQRLAAGQRLRRGGQRRAQRPRPLGLRPGGGGPAAPGASCLAHPAGTAHWPTLWSRPLTPPCRGSSRSGARPAGQVKVVILVPATESTSCAQIVGTTQDLSQIAALATAEISTRVPRATAPSATGWPSTRPPSGRSARWAGAS